MTLEERWTTLAGPDAAPLGAELIARWAEPHRRYHTLAHLTVVLDGVDELASQADDADAVRYAAWFHDAVYGTGAAGDSESASDSASSPAADSASGPAADSAAPAASDEELSALLAESSLPAIGVEASRVAEVGRLVRLTAGHAAAADDRNGAVLCDADLAILGSGPDAYAAYTEAVRAEYASIPDEFFRPGRTAILRDLLALPHLFRTPLARERYEERARANLRDEIAALEA